jgi:hypothetical protein
MKKKYLLYAGIISATILVILFAGILLTGSFSIFSPVAIDPIPDHAAGDLVVITGTTNRMAGTVLELDIIAATPAPGTNPRVGGTDAFIVQGGRMSNTWSGALDTSAIPRGEYLVKAYWVNETVRSDLLATSRLRLTGTKPTLTESPGTPANQTTVITVNPPGTIWRGEKLLVTGTTSLPEDTGLLYLVVQQSNTSVFTVDPKTGKQEERGGFTRSGLLAVLPGTGGVNRWSFALDSTGFIPDQYQVIVTLENISTEKIGKEGPFGTAPFVVKEAILNSPTTPVPEDSPCRSITIDAFPDRWINQSYTITGTTSFPPGTELLVQVFPTEYDLTMNMGIKHPAASMSGAMGGVTVEKGNGSANLWSLALSKGHMDPNQQNYLVNVSNDRIDNRTYETIYGDAFCSKRLVLPG